MRTLLLLCLLVAAVPACTAGEAKPTPQLRLLVPAYFYPAGKGLEDWRRMAKAAKDVPIIAIANPASGPGKQVDPNYIAAIKLARDAGVTVIGYVSTSYAKRPLKDVQADVERWKDLYPRVNGIFLDEQASGKESVPYYSALATFAQVRWSKNPDVLTVGHGDPLVVSNPGTVCAQEFVTPWSGINLFCLQENRFGLERYQPPDWLKSVPPAQVLGLVYSEPSIARMRANVQEALRKRVGYHYVTDRTGANPWDGLPGYWELEVAELRRVNGKAAAPGLYIDVPQTHWAYDALQQLAQRGIFPGFPNVTVAGKIGLTRICFGQSVRHMLGFVDAIEPPGLKAWQGATRDLIALEKLAQEFREELGHVGVTPERAAEILGRVRTRVGVGAR